MIEQQGKVMKHLSIILALLISSATASWAQGSSEEQLNNIIELQGKAKELKILRQAWGAYKLENYDVALSLWMPLAEAGNPSAQVFIGLMYNQGNGVEQDENEASKWYALASEQDYAPAKWRLAMLYYHGSGLTQSYQKAADLYHSAAKQGDVYSQKALGEMYSQGFGVPKDNIIAYSWFNIANGNGFKLAQNYQKKIAKDMTPEETFIAEALAEKCKRSSYKNCGWLLAAESYPAKDDN